MLTVKIWQGKYYTTLPRLLQAHKKGEVLIEETDGLKYFITKDGCLIHCQHASDAYPELILLPQ